MPHVLGCQVAWEGAEWMEESPGWLGGPNEPWEGSCLKVGYVDGEPPGCPMPRRCPMPRDSIWIEEGEHPANALFPRELVRMGDSQRGSCPGRNMWMGAYPRMSSAQEYSKLCGRGVDVVFGVSTMPYVPVGVV